MKTNLPTLIVTSLALVTSLAGVAKIITNVTPVHAAAPCIITISGVQYDVAPLLAPGVHPGGTSMFVCGTDLTSVFMSMPTHAADIARMSPYIYVAPTNTPSPTAVPTAIPTVTPTIIPTGTPSPTVTPVPSTSVSPTPSTIKHDDDELEDENELNEIDDHGEEKEDAHKTNSNSNSDHHKENKSYHSEDHRSPVSVVNSQKHQDND